MVKFSLRQPGGAMLDLPQQGLRAGRDSYDLELRQDMEYAPGESEPHVVGDGVELARPFSLSFLIKAADVHAASASEAEIRAAAETASTLVRETAEFTTYRALTGLELIESRPERELVTDLWRVQMTVLTRFPRWTNAVAETQSAYDGASKLLF